MRSSGRTPRAAIGLVVTALLAMGSAISCAAPTGPTPTPQAQSAGALAAALAAAEQDKPDLQSDASRAQLANPQRAGELLRSFSRKFLRASNLQVPADQNLVFSPYAVYRALAMAQMGARSTTATQLDQLLGADLVDQISIITAVDQALSAAVGSSGLADTDPADPTRQASGVQIEFGNGVWADDTLEVEQNYLYYLAYGFGTGLYQTSFVDDPIAARAELNGWIARRSDQAQTQIFDDTNISAATRLILTCGVGVRAAWATPFVPSAPAQVFNTSTGQVTAAFIESREPLPANAGTGWQSVTIPYRGHGLVLTIIVPDLGQENLVASSLDDILYLIAQPTSQVALNIRLPTFQIASTLDAAATAKSLGAPYLFNEQADLTGISESATGLHIGTFVHRTEFSVNEFGSQVVAGTIPPEGPKVAEAGEITVDRPFFFVVQDTTTWSPLILGRIADPTAGVGS